MQDEAIQRGRCPTCGLKTHKFKMPLSIDGTVDNGVCLACDVKLKDPPEDIPLLSSTPTEQTASAVKKGKKSPSPQKPRFSSELKALEWYRTQQQEKPAVKENHSIESVQAEPIAEKVINTKPSSPPAAGQPKSPPSKLTVRVVTSANQKQFPFVTLDLDPCTPTSAGSDRKPPSTPQSPGFQTLEEAKQFIQQKSAQKRKPKQQLQQQQSAARTKRSKPTQQRQAGRTSKQAPQQIKEGTQIEFNRIMKKNNALSNEMKHSMFVAAVLSRKNDKLSASETFLAANGKLYPDLRSNFGKYSNMKQCGVCKQRVQGAYYCRLKHCHLEVPDHDGGNSAECLKNLFRKSVEELERIQRSYVGDFGDDLFESTDKLSKDHGKDWSLDQLNEDLLFHVASYIPSLPDLALFCSTSKRANALFTNSAQCERLLRGVYINKFGERGAQGNYDINIAWRERWSMLHSFKNALQHSTKLSAPCHDNLRRTIGVLSEQDETDAIFYDNPDYVDPEQQFCNGYFGMHMLHLPPPPNAGENWKPSVLLHGDFHGVRIFNSLQDAICKPSDEDAGRAAGFSSLGDDEYGGQVLSIIHCDDIYGANSPCCFIGYASGRVAAVTAKLSEDMQHYSFIISAQNQAHESEVTCFTFAKLNDTTLLFSACCGGAIRFYPNALKSGDDFNLQSILAFTNFYNCGIFSITSSVIQSDNESFSILCTGDRDGKVRLWNVGNDVHSTKNFRHLGQYNSSTQTGTGFHLVTKAKFINHNVLVTGTNQGSIRIWCLECKDNPGRSIGKGPLPKLNLRYDLMGQHSGSVEVCTNIGDILLTSGGDDGKIVGWDINSGMKIGPPLSCHYGKKLTRLDDGEEVTVYSSVIDFVLNTADGKLITLCRDGVLAEWSFQALMGAG